MSTASAAERKGSPGQQDDDPQAQGRKRLRYSVPDDLPKNIWHDILSLLPLPDAARAGCVSRTFLSCWRSHPNLTLSRETLGLNENACRKDKLAQIFSKRVDRIMKKHSGGVKTFELSYNYFGSFLDSSYLNRWLEIAVTPGIEEVKLSMPLGSNAVYDFPCSVLSNGSGNSIRHLQLSRCAFHPTAGLGCLTRLHLSHVHITGDELGHLLSNSLAMEELFLNSCDKIIRLKISCLLHRLNNLSVFDCTALEVIENKAPNVSLVRIDGAEKRLVGDLLQVKDLRMLDYDECDVVHYACSKLPFIMPNLETLGLSSAGEMFNTPILGAKFLYLKNLQIDLDDGQMGGFSPAYDYFSLAYFLDACPVLVKFVLGVSQTRVKHELISDGDSDMRRMPGHLHYSVKNVRIMGFCSAKSMVELTCHILENATSLKRLTLDTVHDNSSYGDAERSCVGKKGECNPKRRSMIMHAHKGLEVIGKYVVEKVPSTVQLNVKKLCNRCHKIKSKGFRYEYRATTP